MRNTVALLNLYENAYFHLILNRFFVGSAMNSSPKTPQDQPLRLTIYHLLGGILCGCIILMTSPAWADLSRADKLFAQKRYIAAAPEYFKIYLYPNNNEEKLEATYGLARALERADLPYSSSKYYSMIFLQGPDHRHFKSAMSALGRIDNLIGLGRSHAIQLFARDLNPSQISGSTRGFYFYYKGLEAFSRKQWAKAAAHFRRIGSASTYYHKAQFHLGVITTLRGNPSRSIRHFQIAKLGSPTLMVQSYLNMARIHYEKNNFRLAFQNYASIQRDDEYWLDTIFESAWAFYLLQKHNHVLGNIHTILSPFYNNRFYPEAYILQAITFLRLCRYRQVQASQRLFKSTYKPINLSLKRLMQEYADNPKEFFNIIKAYQNGSLSQYEKAWPVLNHLARTNIFKTSFQTIRRAENELAKLSNTPVSWRQVGLEDELGDFLDKKRSAAVLVGGRNLIDITKETLGYLRSLTSQTDFIQLEINLGKISRLRTQLKVAVSLNEEKTRFIGGLQELTIGQALEYWPFQGEYWEDELGGYVFNIDSKCKADSS